MGAPGNPHTECLIEGLWELELGHLCSLSSTAKQEGVI